MLFLGFKPISRSWCEICLLFCKSHRIISWDIVGRPSYCSNLYNLWHNFREKFVPKRKKKQHTINHGRVSYPWLSMISEIHQSIIFPWNSNISEKNEFSKLDSLVRKEFRWRFINFMGGIKITERHFSCLCPSVPGTDWTGPYCVRLVRPFVCAPDCL